MQPDAHALPLRLRPVVPDVLVGAGFAEALAQQLGIATDPAARLAAIDAHADAGERLRLIAWHLGRRDCVWWAYLCVALVRRRAAAPTLAVMDAVDSWLRHGDDAARYRAYDDAGRLGFDRPEALLGLASFLSGASTAPPNLPLVPPAPGGATVAALAAVDLAARFDTPDERLDRATALALAGAIARGDSGQSQWEAAMAAPAGGQA